jgi:hypothetical protein
MVAIMTLLVALPLGYLVPRRLVAYLAYGLAFAHVFTFQTLALLLEWGAGSDEAFARDGTAPVDYLVVTTAIYAVGFGLVTLGHWLRARRTGRVTGIDLDRARS